MNYGIQPKEYLTMRKRVFVQYWLRKFHSLTLTTSLCSPSLIRTAVRIFHFSELFSPSSPTHQIMPNKILFSSNYSPPLLSLFVRVNFLCNALFAFKFSPSFVCLVIEVFLLIGNRKDSQFLNDTYGGRKHWNTHLIRVSRLKFYKKNIRPIR